MFAKLLDDWAIERANRMMLLPSDNTREWLKDFAAWLDYRAAQQGVQRTCSSCGGELQLLECCVSCGSVHEASR